MEKEWYTVEELAAIWELKVETVRTYIRSGQLQASKFGKYRVHRDEKKRFEEARRTKKDTP